MDHKIKPNLPRIGISFTWPTISYYNSLLEDRFLTTIIKQIFLKFKILTSEISIKKLSNYYIFVFTYYPLIQPSTNKAKGKIRIKKVEGRVFSFIKGILEQSLGKRVYFRVVQAPSFISNAEILASWVQLNLLKKPKMHKSIVFKVLREWQLFGSQK